MIAVFDKHFAHGFTLHVVIEHDVAFVLHEHALRETPPERAVDACAIRSVRGSQHRPENLACLPQVVYCQIEYRLCPDLSLHLRNGIWNSISPLVGNERHHTYLGKEVVRNVVVVDAEKEPSSNPPKERLQRGII